MCGTPATSLSRAPKVQFILMSTLVLLKSHRLTVFDNAGQIYKVKKIVNAASGYKLDAKKYLAYSPVHSILPYVLFWYGLT